MEMNTHLGFFIEGGAVGTFGIDNTSNTCALNTILRMCVNSDYIIDAIFKEDLKIPAKSTLDKHRKDLYSYLFKYTNSLIDYADILLRFLILNYDKNFPETYRMGIQFIENHRQFVETMKLDAHTQMDDLFQLYSDYMSKYYKRVTSGRADEKERSTVARFTRMQYDHLLMRLKFIDYRATRLNDLQDTINFRLTSDSKDDFFVRIGENYIHDSLPIYRYIFYSERNYICTDVLMMVGSTHCAYYSFLDGYLQNDSNIYYVSPYSLIFTSQPSTEDIRKSVKSNSTIHNARRMCFFNIHMKEIKLIPTMLHYQYIDGIDKYISNSPYAKRPTVNKVKNTLNNLIHSLELLLHIIDQKRHKEYFNDIKKVYNIYSRPITCKEDIEKMEADLMSLPYNMFETYVDTNGNNFKASKLLQNLYDEI